MKKYFHTVSPELFIWISGMLFLALYPFESGHFSVCPIKNIGLPYCPGCGLGMSIHNLFHMDIVNSFNSHPLGIFALLVITWRIITLIRNSLTQINKRNYNG